MTLSPYERDPGTVTPGDCAYAFVAGVSIGVWLAWGMTIAGLVQ